MKPRVFKYTYRKRRKPWIVYWGTHYAAYFTWREAIKKVLGEDDNGEHPAHHG